MENSKNKIRSFLLSICQIVFLFFFSGTIAMACDATGKKADFNIISKFYADGSLISSPQMMVNINQKASIFISNKNSEKLAEPNSLKLTLIVKKVLSSEKKSDLKISYDIYYQNGKNKKHFKPQMIIALDQEGALKFSDAGHSYELHVLAKKE